MIKFGRIVFLSMILVACGKQNPLPIVESTFPDSIILQVIDESHINRSDSLFKFSKHGENIIEGTINTTEIGVNILHLELHQLNKNNNLPDEIITSKNYPLAFSGDGLKYRLSIDFIKNLPISPEDTFSIIARACQIIPPGQEILCAYDSIKLSFEP